MPRFGFGSCDRRHKSPLSTPSFFGQPLQCEVAHTSSPMAVLRVPALRPIIMPRRLREPAPERAYERANARIDRLEDTITHFCNVIKELRERVSTLEKKLERLSH